MSEDTSGHDAFAAALSGADAPQIEGTVDAGAVEEGQGGEGQGTAQPEPAVATPEAQPVRTEGGLPDWRIQEIREKREADRRERAQEQRELAELRQSRKEQEAERARKEQEAALATEDFYGSDPAQFIDKRFQHNAQQAISPIQREIQELRAERQQERVADSLEYVTEKHGRETVAAAEQRFIQKIQADPQGMKPVYDAIMKHRKPYAELLRLDREEQVRAKIGDDPDAYEARIRAEERQSALKDPEHLQRALEAHRSVATPVQTGVPGRAQPSAQARGTLPSLNRQTSAADDGAEDEDGNAVFQDALRTPRR